MPKSRRRKPKKPQQQLPQQRPTKSEHPRRFRRGLRIGIEWLLGIATLAAFLIAVLPRPTVEPGVSLGEPDILSTTFVIRNSNIIPLERVAIVVHFRSLEVAGKTVLSDMGVILPEWRAKYLASDQGVTIDLTRLMRCPSLGQACPVTKADVDVIVSYRPWVIPWQRQKSFHFAAVHRTIGPGFVWEERG